MCLCVREREGNTVFSCVFICAPAYIHKYCMSITPQIVKIDRLKALGGGVGGVVRVIGLIRSGSSSTDLAGGKSEGGLAWIKVQNPLQVGL